MKSLRIIVYENDKEIEDINIFLSKSYVFFSDLHPEIMMYSKEDVLKEIETRLKWKK